MRFKLPFTLYKRGKVWYFRCYTPDGIRMHGISTGMTSKAAAFNFCNKLYLEGKLYQNDVTFQSFAEGFLDDDAPYVTDRSKPLSKSSLHLYRNCLNIHLLPKIGHKKLVDINYSYLKKIRSEYLAAGLSSATVIQIFSMLKKIILAAYRDNLINKNPFEGFEQIELIQKTHDAFSRDEVRDLIKFMPDPYKNICVFMALTGLRISEAMAISFDDITATDNYIYVQVTRQYLKNQYEELKTACSRRNVPIINDVENYLPDPYMSLPKFYRLFKDFTTKVDPSGARNLAIHSLRHFFITDSKACGINDRKVEVLAGHKIKGVEGVYTNYKVDNLLDILGWQREVFDYIK